MSFEKVEILQGYLAKEYKKA